MSSLLFNFKLIDSHTGGEPTRMVYAGFPDLIGNSIQEKLQYFKEHYDHLRKSIILEPRGNDVLVGALLVEPIDTRASIGVIFFNNHGYLGMCGHGTIGVIASLAYQKKILPGVHVVETPVGLVKTILHNDGSCSVENIPAYRYKKAVGVQVPSVGIIYGDIAWGGNWFFLISEHKQVVTAKNVEQLTRFSQQVKDALMASGITGKDNAEIDHIELFANSELDTANSKNFVLCPGSAYDRSPCGTGTSAKLACLAADNILEPEAPWIQESIIGSIFHASYKFPDNTIFNLDSTTVEISDQSGPSVIPTICGHAYICADISLVAQQNDPFKWGISLC